MLAPKVAITQPAKPRRSRIRAGSVPVRYVHPRCTLLYEWGSGIASGSWRLCQQTSPGLRRLLVGHESVRRGMASVLRAGAGSAGPLRAWRASRCRTERLGLRRAARGLLDDRRSGLGERDL